MAYKCGLQKLVPEQNMDFKYGYRTKMLILFRYQYLKSKFCSGTHIWSPYFVPVTIFWEPSSVPVTCFWEGGCLQIFRKTKYLLYDKKLLLRFFTHLVAISGQGWIQCINKNFKLIVPLKLKLVTNVVREKTTTNLQPGN